MRIPGGRVELATLVEGGQPHTVQVRPFYIARTETTQEVVLVWALALDVPEERDDRKNLVTRSARRKEAEARTGCSDPRNPYRVRIFGGTGTDDGLPAANVPPESAIAYCKWLGRQNDRKVRLPTEAEWQLAALAGQPTTRPATPTELRKVAWFIDNSEEEEHPVGKLKPNAFGLYDMLGNVGEWVLLENGEYCLKGGSFRSEPRFVHAADRRKERPKWRERDPQDPKRWQMYTDAPFAGFRMVCEE